MYKTCSAKYTNEEVERLSGTIIFISYEQLFRISIKDALKLRDTEELVGMRISIDGIDCIIENKTS